MKECLQCKKEFEPIRDSNKFCNNYCRVKWHRANPKPKTKEEKVTEVKLQVLYNSLLDMVAAFSEAKENKSYSIKVSPVTPNSFDAPKQSKTWTDELGQWEEPKITRTPKSVVKYVSERLQIDTPEDYEEWLKELESDPYLSDRDKKAAKINTL